jgi:hypothetical protein
MNAFFASRSDAWTDRQVSKAGVSAPTIEFFDETLSEAPLWELAGSRYRLQTHNSLWRIGTTYQYASPGPTDQYHQNGDNCDVTLFLHTRGAVDFSQLSRQSRVR